MTPEMKMSLLALVMGTLALVGIIYLKAKGLA